MRAASSPTSGSAAGALLLARRSPRRGVWPGIGPIGEALGVAAARLHDFAYAQARGLGSIGFLAANLVVGVLIARFGTGHRALVDRGLPGRRSSLLALGHPGGRRVGAGAAAEHARDRAAGVNPVFAIFMVAVAFTQASHAVLYAFGSLHWRALGIGEAEIGALWAVSVAGRDRC